MLETTIGGRYFIFKELGKGAFGQTYLAEDRQVPGHPNCVVKQLKPQSNDELTLREARRLFTNEAEVLSRLSDHPQIPRLLAYYPEEFCLVQEFIAGHDLSQEIALGKQFSEMAAVEMLQEVLQVLVFIHNNYVIHRDLKPSNIRRTSEGRLVLIDFGTVKQIQTLITDPNGEPKTTIVAGTQGYMPPEQLKGKPRANSDIYALGAIAIFALTGKSPAQLDEDPQTCDLVWRQHASVSKRLADIIDKMVRFDHMQRYESATDVLNDLETTKTQSTKQRKHFHWRQWLLAGITGVAIMVAGVWLFAFLRGFYLYYQGNALLESGEYQSAIALYEQVLETYPGWAEVWFKQGLARQQLGQYEQAFVAYERALAIKPGYQAVLERRQAVLQKLSEQSLNNLKDDFSIQSLP